MNNEKNEKIKNLNAGFTTEKIFGIIYNKYNKKYYYDTKKEIKTLYN